MGRSKIARTESLDDTLSRLHDRKNKCETVISELKESEGWRILIEDLSRTRQELDDHWHLIDPKSDEKKLNEFRVTKLAINTLINTVNTYTEELDRVNSEIEHSENPDKFQTSDYAD